MNKPEGATIELLSYDPRFREPVVTFWNRVFADSHRFLPVNVEQWQFRVEEGGSIEPLQDGQLQLAMAGEAVVGLAQGGVWSVENSLRPDAGSGHAQAYLSMIAVDSQWRRQKIGTRLLAQLQLALAEDPRVTERGSPRWLADGRMYNPCYGNAWAPVPPFWGTTEGAAVASDDPATCAFFNASGFAQESIGVTLSLDALPAGVLRLGPLPNSRAMADVEAPVVSCAADYLPELGSADGVSFAAPNNSLTWVATLSSDARGGVERIQVGSLTAYPFDTSAEWGIHSLEVLPDFRGRGLGRLLLRSALHELLQRGATTIETLVVPDEAPAALRLYEHAGFESLRSWSIFE